MATNKLVSQIASKLKKPSAFEFVPPGHEAEFLFPLANKWLPGVGPKTSHQLNAAGLARIGQIAQTPADLLGLLIGNMAPQLRNFARGIDERPIIPVRAPAKSYSEQETFPADTTNEEFLDATLRRMADKLMAKVRDDDKSIRTLTVKIRYNDMDEEQAAESLPEPTDLETELYSKISALLRKAWKRRVSLRLVSLKLSNVYDGSFRAGLGLDISARQHDAQQRLAAVVDTLRQKFGRRALLRGHDFILREVTSHKSEIRNSKPETNPKSGTTPKSKPPSLNPQPSTLNPSYNLAVLQRQRIGNSFARVLPPPKPRPSTSPAPELRFRNAPSTFDLRPSTLGLYTPLNLHSYYSFLDSTLSIQTIVELAKRYELPAIALTDKNNLHGAVEFAQASAQAGIKPIIGTEIHWHDHPLCLYVQNQTGYQNLCRILSRKKVQSPKPKTQSQKFDFEGWSLEFGASEGLLAVSPFPALAPLFPDRFYLAIDSLAALERSSHPSTHPLIHPSIHPFIHSSTAPPIPQSLPLVASFPVHYALPADRWKYDIVQSIRTLTLLRQTHPAKRLDGQYHFRTPAEMQPLFAAHPELLAHSREIADRCSFTFLSASPNSPATRPRTA